VNLTIEGTFFSTVSSDRLYFLYLNGKYYVKPTLLYVGYTYFFFKIFILFGKNYIMFGLGMITFSDGGINPFCKIRFIFTKSSNLTSIIFLHPSVHFFLFFLNYFLLFFINHT